MDIKELADIILVTISIAVVGIWATLRATGIQTQNAKTIAQIQAEQSLQQSISNIDIDLTEQFLSMLKEETICEKPGRVRILLSSASLPHSKRIEKLYVEECPNNKNTETSKAVDEAAKRQVAILIEALEGSARRSARNQLAQLYPQRPDIVASALATAIKDNFDNYRITLGVLTVLGKVDNWKNPDLEEQVERLSMEPPKKSDSTFKEQLSNAKQNNPNLKE